MSILPIQGSRRQASMFLSNKPLIDLLRNRFNPEQAKLIPTHVTLCREDEVKDWSRLVSRIRDLPLVQITMAFGTAVRDGNLVFLPVVGGREQFDELRNYLLGNGTSRPRKHSPHATIVHARNRTCTDEVFAEILAKIQPFTTALHEIALIEQFGSGPWSPFARFGASLDNLEVKSIHGGHPLCQRPLPSDRLLRFPQGCT